MSTSGALASAYDCISELGRLTGKLLDQLETAMQSPVPACFHHATFDIRAARVELARRLAGAADGAPTSELAEALLDAADRVAPSVETDEERDERMTQLATMRDREGMGDVNPTTHASSGKKKGR